LRLPKVGVPRSADLRLKWVGCRHWADLQAEFLRSVDWLRRHPA